MRRLIAAGALVLAVAMTVVTVPGVASAEHLPAFYACSAYMPHSGDYMESYYWTDDGDGAYRCIARHPQSGTDGTHYYIVCHDTYYWWWVPGLSAWVNLDC